jgi:periplasmic copper chaperone A
MRSFAFITVFFAASAWAQVEIEEPWIRATAPGAKSAAGYMVIRNKGAQADRLVGGASAVAARIETHVHVKDGEILRMREVKGFDVPAKGVFELRPGGAHLMLVDIKRPLKEGERVSVTLKFERAGELKVEFHVGRLTAQSSPHKH